MTTSPDAASSDAPIMRPVARTRAGAGASALGPADWLHAALALLVTHSIEAVTIDVIAKALKVTRGSFYWHFKDRDDLLKRLLALWRDETTAQMSQCFETPADRAPRELIGELLSMPFRSASARDAAAIELSIRAWARSDLSARHALDAVDAERLSYIAQWLSSIGRWSIGESRTRAFVLYGYVLTESLLQHQGSERQRLERRAWIEREVLKDL